MIKHKTENNMSSSCLTRRSRNGVETGRSMVEMLGVLAVVGVLSVGGIAGYTYAMNKHYANELLAGASERAVLVTAQLASGRKPSLKEFANYTTTGGTFETDDESIRVYTDGIGIPVSGVKGAVCENLIKATDGTDILITDIDENEMSADNCAEESNDLLFVFETGIGVPKDIEKVCKEGAGDKPGPCSKCILMDSDGDWGEWVDSDELCATGERCHDSNCVAIEGEGCVKNSDCDEGEFCLYSSVDAVTGPTERGTCESVEDAEGDFANGCFLSRYEMDWFSAQNFCRGLGQNLASRSYFDVPSESMEDCLRSNFKVGGCSYVKMLHDELGMDFSCWFRDLEGDGEAARFAFGTSSTPLNEKTFSRDAEFLAACTDI